MAAINDTGFFNMSQNGISSLKDSTKHFCSSRPQEIDQPTYHLAFWLFNPAPFSPVSYYILRTQALNLKGKISTRLDPPVHAAS